MMSVPKFKSTECIKPESLATRPRVGVFNMLCCVLDAQPSFGTAFCSTAARKGARGPGGLAQWVRASSQYTKVASLIPGQHI